MKIIFLATYTVVYLKIGSSYINALYFQCSIEKIFVKIGSIETLGNDVLI